MSQMKIQNNDIIIYEVIPTDEFNDNMKFYIKKKKYKHISKDIQDILYDLEKGVFHGDLIDDLKDCNNKNNKAYKIRAISSDMNQGKSNGYRLLYYVESENKIVFLLTIYCKKDKDRIPKDNEIVDLIKKYCL